MIDWKVIVIGKKSHVSKNVQPTICIIDYHKIQVIVKYSNTNSIVLIIIISIGDESNDQEYMT